MPEKESAGDEIVVLPAMEPRIAVPADRRTLRSRFGPAEPMFST